MTDQTHHDPSPAEVGEFRSSRSRRDAFSRSPDQRLLAGVAGGLAEQAGVSPAAVRVAFVALTLAGGIGAVLYAVAWAMADVRSGPPLPAPDPRLESRRILALTLMTLGALLLLRRIGVWFGDDVVWPLLIAVTGSAVIWARSMRTENGRLGRLAAQLPDNPLAAVLTGPASAWRLIAGAALIAVGLSAFVFAQGGFGVYRQLALAMTATIAGASLAFGPWVWRLVQQLSDERRERIRSEERAEMAAHLHDSVLQTLALIQRSADHPRRTVILARRQERELRSWLYGRTHADADHDSLRAAVDALAEEIETNHDITVDTVVVGERGVDDGVRALLAATREAANNAARHAGVTTVSVFVEVRPNEIEAFVRDRGRGFEVGAVEPDRHGIAHSIRGRMARHGGRAEITSVPGEGTEVLLRLPLRGRDDMPAPPAEPEGVGEVQPISERTTERQDPS